MSKKMKEKVIKDIVHDYVEINDFFETLINTKYFQRLRFIKQLTCQYVYPSANHTRFEHSLGVYHLSRTCLKSLAAKLYKNFDLKANDFENILFNLSIAALLHDIGHAPLSHLGELYYNKKEIIGRLESLSFERFVDENIFNVGSKHELMSCYIILEHFYNLILNHKFVMENKLQVDFELICRMIVGAKYTKRCIENIAIEILNSNTIDMDKLDYIMRDSYMTGVSVPKIDVNRFFKGLNIDRNGKKLILEKQAITVAQNIIDARDCLYLLVYNHHITVYTDFVYEFYVKHLMLKYDKGSAAITEDKLCAAEMFSCRSISEKLMTDDDLVVKLKEYYVGNGKYSSYTKTLAQQIFERNFLKPLWKNLYEYKIFLTNSIKDSSVIKELEEKMCAKDYVYRSYIVHEIIKKTGIRLGEIFIVPRSNKFYSLNSENKFYILVDEDLKEISELLPQKQFKDLYNNVSFYIFCKDEDKPKVEEAFVDIVRLGLPERNEIKYQVNIPNWLKES